GIRDFHVTGVQTCALPISRRTRHLPRPRRPSRNWTNRWKWPPTPRSKHLPATRLAKTMAKVAAVAVAVVVVVAVAVAALARARQIGRASCRARARAGGGAG